MTKKMILYFRQGDILLEKINDNIKGVEKQKIEIQDNIIAHGESGNQHKMSQQVVLFEDLKTKQRYVKVTSPQTELVHQEHKKIQIPQGLYKIRREREYNAFEKSIRQVQD